MRRMGNGYISQLKTGRHNRIYSRKDRQRCNLVGRKEVRGCGFARAYHELARNSGKPAKAGRSS